VDSEFVTTNTQFVHKSIGGKTLGLLFLLSLSVFINYVDRGNLSVAAPLLKGELNLSASQLGVLLGAFFWTYMALMIVSGWLVDRFHVGRVLAVGFAVWSLATGLTGLVHGFATLLICRMLLGAGESVAFPAYGKILARHVPQEHRGLANAIITCGMTLGPAVGTLGCGRLMATYGWRPVFVFLGFVSLIWMGPWIRWMPKAPVDLERSVCPASVGEILRRRAFWGAALGHFCLNYPLYLMIVWLPYYLVSERHLSMKQMAEEGALFYLMYAIAAPILAWIADHFIRTGMSANFVRKLSMAIGHILVAAGLLGCAAGSARTSFIFLMITGAACGFAGPNTFVFAQTFAGPAVAGRWTGLQNCFANLAGVVVAPLTGLVVDRTGQFWWAFVVAAAITLSGGAFWVFLTGPLQQLQWPAEIQDRKDPLMGPAVSPT
jgi:ACS family D-galactonate transporter-like MFS transporter